ncbi:MAG: preprotein translocase subunit SecY [Candidatus Bathyarchaeia archaeon]
MPGRFLSFFRPVARVMPEVKAPERRGAFNEKLLWTALVVVSYFILSEIPIYGAVRQEGDPYYYLRVIFASSRGSLMELGIQPIVTSGIITQLISSSGLIGFDRNSSEDRETLSGVTKFFAILMTGLLAAAYILSGVYGRGLSTGLMAAIFVQLFTVGILVILLDELLQKGWGLGSGISLFIAGGVAQKIIWDLFSPIPFEENGNVFGSLIAFFQSVFRGESLLSAFVRRSRPDAPTMLGLLVTIAVFLVVIYMEALKVEIPISYAKYRGFRGQYPVKFLYVSNIPVILVSSLFMDVYFVAQIIWSRFNAAGDNIWLNWIGVFRENEPVSGLAYYMTSPRNLEAFIADPVRGLVYTGLLVGLCVLFGIIWLQVSGMDPASVAEQLVDSGLQIPGFRRSVKPIQSVLERYIPTVAVLGSIAVGLVASVSDFFGAYGTGMGILLTVGILYQVYQAIAQEQMWEMFPLLRRFIGE